LSLQRYRQHRDLHSFPTRRSSDLKHKIHTENTSESPHSLESSLAHLKCYRLKLKHMKINLNNKTKLGEGLSDVVKRRPCSNVLRSEEHTSELQSRFDLVCRLLLEK